MPRSGEWYSTWDSVGRPVLIRVDKVADGLVHCVMDLEPWDPDLANPIVFDLDVWDGHADTLVQVREPINVSS